MLGGYGVYTEGGDGESQSELQQLLGLNSIENSKTLYQMVDNIFKDNSNRFHAKPKEMNKDFNCQEYWGWQL